MRARPGGAGDRESLRARGLRLSSLEIARKIVDAAEDKKAADIVLLDVSELTSMADYFVICSGGSERQLGAIGDGIAERLRDEGVRPIGREGGSNAHWTLLDFGAVIVHIFAHPSATTTSSSATVQGQDGVASSVAGAHPASRAGRASASPCPIP